MDLLFRIFEHNGSIRWNLHFYEADKATVYVRMMGGILKGSNAHMGAELRRSTMLEF